MRTKYDVFIGRNWGKWVNRYYISVKPKGREAWVKTEHSFTLWGAKLNARRMVKKLEAPVKDFRVKEYEL